MKIKFYKKWLNLNQLTICAIMLLGVTEVLGNNVDIAENETQAQALMYAASGDLNSLKHSINLGVDINAKDKVFNATALHNAASQGHLHTVEWLLSNGANIEAQDNNGSTPLLWALYHGQLKIVEKLVAAKSNVNHVPKKGPTALILAVQSGKVELVKILLENGAQKDLPSVGGISPMQAAKTTHNDEMLKLIKSGELN